MKSGDKAYHIWMGNCTIIKENKDSYEAQLVDGHIFTDAKEYFECFDNIEPIQIKK